MAAGVVAVRLQKGIQSAASSSSRDLDNEAWRMWVSALTPSKPGKCFNVHRTRQLASELQ